MNCTLRPWQPEDAQALAHALSNRKILNHLRDDLPYPYTVHGVRFTPMRYVLETEAQL